MAWQNIGIAIFAGGRIDVAIAAKRLAVGFCCRARLRFIALPYRFVFSRRCIAFLEPVVDAAIGLCRSCGLRFDASGAICRRMALLWRIARLRDGKSAIFACFDDVASVARCATRIAIGTCRCALAQRRANERTDA